MSLDFGNDFLDVIFLLLRLFAAAGAALAGWLFGGLLAQMLYRVVFLRPMPRSAIVIAKLVCALLLGLLVFWFLPLGWGGGTGGGKGGGTGQGVGPGIDGPGTGTQKGKGSGEATKKADSPGTTKGKEAKEILAVELLGGEAVKEGKYYLIERKPPPVDAAALAKYLTQNHTKLAGIDIVLTKESVNEDHQAVRQLHQMAQDHQLRSLIVTPKDD